MPASFRKLAHLSEETWQLPKLISRPFGAPGESPVSKNPATMWLLALLFTGMLFGYAQRGAFSVAAPFMTKTRLSKAGLGVLLSAFFWSYSLMPVPAGWT